MSLGLGIFLSTVFLSLIYMLTKKLLPWKKCIKFIAIFVLSIFIISFIIYFGVEKYKAYPRAVKEYWNIKIGDDSEDVLFYKGKPQDEFEKFGGYALPDANNKSKWDKYKIPPNTKDADFKTIWDYKEDDSYYRIEFTKDKKVKSVTCSGNFFWHCPSVSTISIGSSFENIVKIFGYPKEENYEKSFGFRYLYYPEYNIKFHLEKNKVTKIMYLKHSDKRFTPEEHGARELNNSKI